MGLSDVVPFLLSDLLSKLGAIHIAAPAVSSDAGSALRNRQSAGESRKDAGATDLRAAEYRSRQPRLHSCRSKKHLLGKPTLLRIRQ